MKNLLKKELRLSTPVLTYLFIGFGLMAFIPGYPVLCSAFFICLGIFQGYQLNREANDIMYMVLLPIRKTEAVQAKYAAAVFIQMTGFILFSACTVIRMAFLSEAEVYVQNVMMAANPAALGFMLLIYAAFNILFIGGFFKTAYKVGQPFVVFIVVCFVIIGIGEALHHLPGFLWINELTGNTAQAAVLVAGAAVYIIGTVFASKKAQIRFSEIDL